jgi:hypothetical protein
MDSHIPKWVPESARKKISEMYAAADLREEERKLLDRFACYLTMDSGVWQKLPLEPADLHGSLIEFAFLVVINFSALIPRPGPKAKWAKSLRWSEILHQSPPGESPDSAALIARYFLQSVYALKGVSTQYWDDFWEGDRSINLDKIIDHIEQLASFYNRLAMRRQQWVDSLPRIKWPYSKNTPRHFFSQAMSQWLVTHYGRPFHEVVTALTEVAFDVSESLEKENIRALHRAAKKAEKSRPKMP